MAGVPYVLGDTGGNMMAVTISFHMIGVDWDVTFKDPDPYFTTYAAKGISEGQLHPNLARLYLMKAIQKGSVFCNSVHVRGMPKCMAMGQATVTDAALTLKGGVALQDIDTDVLVSELTHQGINRLGAAQ